MNPQSVLRAANRMCLWRSRKMQLARLSSSSSFTRDVVATLQSRGLCAGKTSEKLGEIMSASTTTVYAGFDPTADTLHVGNLLTIMALLHFRRAGHRVIALVGGATARVGDPSGRNTERDKIDKALVEHNTNGIASCLERIFARDEELAGGADWQQVQVLNNVEWYKGLQLLDFLSDTGRHFRLSAMLSRESVQRRLASPEGMSFSEFSYQIFQAFDYLHLNQEHGCTVQVGGSDQWGNIVAGVDLIHRVTGKEAHGIILPLVVTSSGEKIGKSAGNAIWLDSARTSPYELYQYLLKTEDGRIESMLKMFTFLSLEEINNLMEQSEKEPEKRASRSQLAKSVVQLVHGDEAVEEAVKATEALFHRKEPLEDLSAEEFVEMYKGTPTCHVSKSLLGKLTIVSLMAHVGLTQSNSAGRRLISSKGLYMNDVTIESPVLIVDESHLIAGRYTVLRKGKSNYRIIDWVV